MCVCVFTYILQFQRFPQQPYKLGGKFFLTEEQFKRVEEVRQQLSLDLTELRDALYK